MASRCETNGGFWAFSASVWGSDSLTPPGIYAILFALNEGASPIAGALGLFQQGSIRHERAAVARVRFLPFAHRLGRLGEPGAWSAATRRRAPGAWTSKRARIRAAARSLFRERGFDGATLRAIASRAEMGASSIYRHFQSKEELLIDELSELQEEAWTRFRSVDDRNRGTADRVRAFLDVQHELFVADRDLTTIALRATTKPEARVAKRVLQLHDRTIGLLMEILQRGRMKKDLAKDVDVLEAARALFHVTHGARIPWANGLVSDDACRASLHQAVDLLFRGIAAPLPASQEPSAGQREIG